MKYILDTCVISELIKIKPYLPVIRWISQADEQDLYISVLTIGEIYKGISKLPDSIRKTKLKKWMDEDLSYRFGNKIIDVNYEIAKTWGKLQGMLEQQGQKMPIIDGFIATTALVYDFTVVTRNESDMKRCGAKILNLWI